MLFFAGLQIGSAVWPKRLQISVTSLLLQNKLWMTESRHSYPLSMLEKSPFLGCGRVFPHPGVWISEVWKTQQPGLYDVKCFLLSPHFPAVLVRPHNKAYPKLVFYHCVKLKSCLYGPTAFASGWLDCSQGVLGCRPGWECWNTDVRRSHFQKM